jgi:hypothetical protein
VPGLREVLAHLHRSELSVAHHPAITFQSDRRYLIDSEQLSGTQPAMAGDIVSVLSIRIGNKARRFK